MSEPKAAIPLFHGMRVRNGWKNSGCPWTDKPTPERMVLPATFLVAQ